MKGYDVMIVRLLPFILFIEMGVHSLLSQNGFEMSDYNYLHSNSAIYAIALFFISLANKRYHCNWNRAMYVFLIVVPLFNYIVLKFDFIPDDVTYLTLFHCGYGITAIITAYMATKHFIMKSIKRYNNG